jgi:hypothetical protein
MVGGKVRLQCHIPTICEWFDRGYNCCIIVNDKIPPRLESNLYIY